MPDETGNILVPYDDSSHARRALALAVDLGKRLGARIHLVHVIQPPTFAVTGAAMGGATMPPTVDMGAWEKDARAHLEGVAGAIEGAAGGVGVHVIRSHAPARGICDAAREIGADWIVMGTHGRTGLAHVFLGSVTERTLRDAPCPVISTRAEEDDPS